MSYTDGNILLGGFEITLDTAGTTLIVDTCSPSFPTKVVARTDKDDLPAAQYIYPDLKTGTMTVQVNATAARGDFTMDTFSTDAITGASKKWVITAQSAAINKGAMVTYDLTFNEVINP